MRRADRDSNIFSRAPSFSFRHRLLRLAWRLAWLLLARWTPPPFHRWRIFVANCFGAKIDGSASLHASAVIWYPPHLTMGPQSILGPQVNCYSMGPISIGPRAIVSQGAFLCTGTHDVHSADFQIMARPIEIGASAWICAEACVGPGVHVGEGAVLGARGVAFHNLAPWTIYVGNPASKKGERTRFG